MNTLNDKTNGKLSKRQRTIILRTVRRAHGDGLTIHVTHATLVPMDENKVCQPALTRKGFIIEIVGIEAEPRKQYWMDDVQAKGA